MSEESWSLSTRHDIKIGKVYVGSDGHKRTVQAVEYHFGNVQIKVHDTWKLAEEWIALPDWRKLNP